MVQVIPKQNAGSFIGQHLGQGLGAGIGKGADIAFQRGMLKQSLAEAAELAKNPNVSPLERNLGLINAFAGIPGAERYVGQILPYLAQQSAFSPRQMQPLPEDLSAGQTTEEGQPQRMVGGQPVPQPESEPFAQEDVDLYEPFLGPNVKKYSPAQIQTVEYNDLAQGLQSSPRADFMRKQNEEIEKAVEGISAKQASFANYYNSIHPELPPDDQRIAIKFARTKDALQAPTNAEKARVVDDYVDRYRALRSNIAKQNPRSMIEKTREKQEQELHGDIDWLIDLGQRDLAKEYLTSTLKFGDSESERIIKKPTAEQENLLTNVKQFPELAVKVPEYGKSSREFQTYNKDRDKALSGYEDRLQKAIQPGTAKKPGTSLLVMRDMAMKSTGMTWPEFNEMVHKLYRDKKIILDPYQRQEMAKLSSPPINGFWDMLLERK